IADPFYSGAAVLTTKFIKERPAVAAKVVAALDQATKLANDNFDKYRPIIAKYTPIPAGDVRLVAQPYLRAWNELNDVDLNSYQALIDVFHKEGALKQRVDVRSIILSKKDLGM
ncbi:MAG TPA: ABC transporter substrate-binding protein, partial [Xanthobacteraceae bacterium]